MEVSPAAIRPVGEPGFALPGTCSHLSNGGDDGSIRRRQCPPLAQHQAIASGMARFFALVSTY